MSKKKNAPSTAPAGKKNAPPPTPVAASPHTSFGFLPYLLLGGLAFLLYANTLGHAYVLDDDLALKLHNHVNRGLAGIGDIFMAPYREGCFGGCLYRPLTLTAFAIEWAIAPNSPAIGHWMNVLWYTATAPLLYATLRLLLHGRSPALPLAAALLFVVHPVHTEVVANIKSRDEIMSLFFGLLSLYFFCRSLMAGQGSTAAWRTGAAIAYACALLSKEGAITMLPVFPLVAWTFYRQSPGSALRASLWLLAPVGVFFLLRGAALSGLTSPPVSYLDNPIVAAKTGSERMLTSMLVLLKYLGLLFLPLTLLSDYSYNAFPLAQSGDVWAILSGLLHLGLLSWALWQLPRRNALAFCVLAYLAAISLYSQLPAVIGTLLGERLLYLPSLWGCLGIALLLARLLGIPDAAAGTAAVGWSSFSPKEKTLLGVVAAVAVVFAFQTLRRNGDWANNLALFGADVVKAPNSVRLNDGYAEELYRSLSTSQDLPEAERARILALSEQHSRRSLSMEPSSLSANINIGNLRFFEHHYAEAAAAYEKCLSIKPDYSFARRNLAAVLIEWAREEGEKKNNPDKARELLLRSLAIDDKNATAWHLVGVSYGVQGQHVKAAEMFEKAVALEPANKEFSRNWVMALRGMGDTAKADEVAKKAGL